jgi:hypothetical protein
MKACNCCGIKYSEKPENAELALDALPMGYYYNCSCGSTLVWSLEGKTAEAVFEDAETMGELYQEFKKVGGQ